ncbi:lanthionine synthetase C-like protein [Clostridium homopropionicum DSM 5847]|uniref:Lanthionine synthetase C-like protein n=1 Tax=Clostridium homopropionicum DSM 5847 TaxID=1121318 RepID=A0A0L6ZAR4_9CLOT|nr:type 2 lanthipeptide synthetase LanM [Clostridium homopropionicum]KOA20066.1 lanthionine synthetase C-like protein [Clostridium homopropionicum DSM 5847]SFG85719.1 type 2 lantibiotic biosynthesis protein LanM [Clostridium homopropionicum]
MRLTEEQKNKIAFQAAFLDERLAGKVEYFQKEISKKQEQRLLQWQKNASGRGGEKSFLQRLKMEEISMEQALIAASDSDGRYLGKLPYYISTLDEMLESFPCVRNNIVGDKVIENEVLVSLMPFLKYAEKHLLEKLGDNAALFTEEALANMTSILENVLIQIFSQVWEERFRLFVLRQESMSFLMAMNAENASRYRGIFADHLLGGGWLEVFTEYPLLGRLMTVYLNYWLENMNALIMHFYQDKEQIAASFNNGVETGKIQSLKGNMGDAHNKGRSVILIGFSSGLSLVYKPRSLEVDVLFIRLIKKLYEEGFPYKLKAPNTISFDDHGWSEFITHIPLNSLEEAREYYKNIGASFALVYVLGGNDFHAENLITSGADPILIDLETIFSYQVTLFNEEIRELAQSLKTNGKVIGSVLSQGILPVWYPVSKDVWLDLGALTGEHHQSVPVMDGKKVPAKEYSCELLEGFKNTYKFFLKNREQFSKEWLETIFINKAQVRFLMRGTRVYALMLHKLTSPRFLKDGFLYSTEIERFAAPYFLGVKEEKSKYLWPIFLSERKAMEERDIPMFFGNVQETGIWDHNDGLLAEEFFESSAIERVLDRITSLSEKDMLLQTELIEESLYIRYRTTHRLEDSYSKEETFNPLTASSISKENLIEEAEALYNDFLLKAISENLENNIGLSYHHNLRNQVINIAPLNLYFYDGFLGISLFFSALYKITKKQEIKESALKGVFLLRESLKNKEYPLPVGRLPLGMGHGVAGIVQVLSLMEDYLEEPELLQDALFLLEKLTPEIIKNEDKVDWFNGIAGLLHASVNIYKRTKNSTALRIADLCGKELINRKATKLLHHGHMVKHVSIDKSFEKTTGLADQSGILYPLAKWLELSSNNEIETILKDGLNSEIELIHAVADQNNSVATSLCGGLSGMGIVQALLLGLPDYKERESSLETIKLVLSTLSNKSLELEDHLCCGKLGRVEFLLQASFATCNPSISDKALEILQNIINSKNEKGYYEILGKNKTMLWNPSFFQGISGIGYMMLRTARPEIIQSIFS